MGGNLVETVGAALDAAGVGGADSVLVVGVSGGMDSVVLAHLLAARVAARGFALHIAHFDHALRAASADDAHFVAELAAAWGLPLHTARWAHGGLFPGGMEAAARAARYAFLADVARSVTPAGQAPTMVVAHHAGDQAETLLLNLVRGSGLHGLAGMRAVSAWREDARAPVTLVRPLLSTPRGAIVAYAEAHGLAWREDASNSDTVRARNLIRHELLPLLAQVNPAAAANLARAAALLAQAADRLDALDVQSLAHATVSAVPEARVLLCWDALLAAAYADRCAILRLALRQTFAHARNIGQAHIEALVAVLDAPPRASGPHPLVDGIAWSIVYCKGDARLGLHRSDLLPLTPDSPWLDAAWRAHVSAQTVVIPGDITIPDGWTLRAERAPLPAAATDDWELWLNPGCATVRLTTPRPGLRIALLGMGGHTRSLGDIFTDRKVAPALRPGWPIVVDANGRVLWLCGLVRAEEVRAEVGAPALHLRWQRTNAKEMP